MQLPFLPPSVANSKPPPKWDPFTPAIARLSRSATTHPVQTLVIVALMASTTYLQMLEHSLFDRSTSFWGNTKRTDILDGSVKVAVGQETAWQWKENAAEEVVGAKHLALVSLSFPPATLETSAPIIPVTSTAKLLSEDDSSKVYSVPVEELPGFINTVKTIPCSASDASDRKHWVMQTGRKSANGGLIARAELAVRELWDMIQVTQTLPAEGN